MALAPLVGALSGGSGGLNSKTDFGSDVLGATGGKQSGIKFNNISSGGGVPVWVIGVALVLAVMMLRKGH